MSDKFVIGLDELERKLKTLDKRMAAKQIRGAASAAANPVVRQARINAPIGEQEHRTHLGNLRSPGFLRRSIRKRTSIKRGFVEIWVGPLREAFYGSQFVELGTSKQRAQQWLVPALEVKGRDFIARFKRDLQRRLLKVARS